MKRVAAVVAGKELTPAFVAHDGDNPAALGVDRLLDVASQKVKSDEQGHGHDGERRREAEQRLFALRLGGEDTKDYTLN